jgi:DNA-binding ferritin-like protein (Dps family)
MKSQYIKLLKKQITKLEDESFDLEAWKTSAISVLQRIFGETDPRAKQIDNLKIDYSSWALRDSNANYKPVETAKLKGKEILNTAIDEIEIFGAPENQAAKVLGQDFAKKIQEMDGSERKKYFDGMKKDELVELLMKVTS